MMGTRSGSVDPGILVHVLRHKKLDANALDKLSTMNRVCSASPAFLPICARSCRNFHTIRTLDWPSTLCPIASCEQSGPWQRRLRIDALVFTAGVGEHAAKIRIWFAKSLSI